MFKKRKLYLPGSVQAFHGGHFDIQWPKEYLLQSPRALVVSKKK
jgi:hypothetical protein